MATESRVSQSGTQVPHLFSRIRKLGVESVWLFAGRVAATLMGLVSVRILTESLPVATYGDLNLLLGLVTLLSTVASGPLSNAANRFYYELKEEGRWQELMGTLWAGGGIASLFVIVGLLIVARVTGFGHTNVALTVVLIFFCTSKVISGIGRPAINLRRRRGALALISTLDAGVGPLLAAAAAVFLAKDLLATTAGYAIGSIGIALLTFGLLYRTNDFAPRQLGQASLSLLRSLVAFGYPAIGTGVLAWVMSVGDRYLLRLFWSSAEVGQYSLGYRAGVFFPQFVSGVYLTLIGPLIMQNFMPQRDRMPNLEVWIGLYACVMIPILVFCLAFPELIVFFFTRNSVYAEVYRVVPFSAFASALYGLKAVISYVLHLRQKLHVSLIFVFIGAIANIVLNLVLIPRMGYMGAAVATVASYSLEFALLATYTLRVFRWHVPWRWIVSGAVAAGLAGMAALAGRSLVGEDWLHLFVLAIVYGVVSLLALLALIWMWKDKLDTRLSVRCSDVGW